MDIKKTNEILIDKTISLSPISKINNNKKSYISLKKNKKLNLDFNSDNSLHKNKVHKKINYLSFREKLLKKCNSQILENREILPILSQKNNNNLNNSSSATTKKNNKHVNSSSKNPIKLQKKYITPRRLTLITNINSDKEVVNQNINENEKKNKLPDISPRILNSFKKNKNDLFLKELFLSHSQRTKLNNSEEKEENENNNNKRKDKKREIFRPFKFSRFYHYSKGRNVSAKQIYEHYISEEYHRNFYPIDDFTKFIEKKFNSPKNKLNKLYGINKSYMNNIEEIKNNNSIAFKEDFNIQEYQKILMGMVKKRISKNTLFDLQHNFQKFNEKILNGFTAHKGRYTKLAEKLIECAPIYLINRLKKLDDDKKIEKAKYFKVNINKQKQEENLSDELEYY